MLYDANGEETGGVALKRYMDILYTLGQPFGGNATRMNRFPVVPNIRLFPKLLMLHDVVVAKAELACKEVVVTCTVAASSPSNL